MTGGSFENEISHCIRNWIVAKRADKMGTQISRIFADLQGLNN